MLRTALRVALMVTLALILTEVHGAAAELKRSLQETAPRYALRCADGGGRAMLALILNTATSCLTVAIA